MADNKTIVERSKTKSVPRTMSWKENLVIKEGFSELEMCVHRPRINQLLPAAEMQRLTFLHLMIWYGKRLDRMRWFLSKGHRRSLFGSQLARVSEVAKTKVTFSGLPVRRRFQVKNSLFTIFVCLGQRGRSGLAWVGRASKCEAVGHIPGSGNGFPTLLPVILECKHFGQKK